MERFAPESLPPENEQPSETSQPKIDRRKFLKLLGVGAGVVAAGEIAQDAEARSEKEGAPAGLQIIDGKMMLWHFDDRGKVTSYDLIQTSRLRDTEIMYSPEVVAAAKELVELRARCQKDQKYCPEVPLAHGRLDIAIRLHGKPPPLPGSARNPHSPRR